MAASSTSRSSSSGSKQSWWAPEVSRVLIFKAGKWVDSHDGNEADPDRPVRFGDIMFFYANIIDYARVVLIVLAGFLVAWGYAFLGALSILVSHLLDWIDGPVARHYGQCSLFGSLVDWLADVQAQLLTAIWWAALEPWVVPWVSFAVLIELTTCLFDISLTVTTRYPVLAKKQSNPCFAILEWATPEGGYNFLGTFLWLAYPIFCLARILDLSWPQRSGFVGFLLVTTELLLFVPAIMYLWNEAAQCALVVSQWGEPARAFAGADGVTSADIQEHAPTFNDGTFAIRGALKPYESSLVMGALADLRGRPEWAAAAAGSEVFWMSLNQRFVAREDQAQYEALRASTRNVPELDLMAKSLMDACYPGEGCTLDGHGFIINPPNSRTQAWHIDYSPDHSSLFIPLDGFSVDNAAQYLAFATPADRAAAASTITNNDVIELEPIRMRVGYISARQLCPNIFDIARMDFGAIHRGICNRTGMLRIVFWISVVRNGAPSPPERVFQDFVGDKSVAM